MYSYYPVIHTARDPSFDPQFTPNVSVFCFCSVPAVELIGSDSSPQCVYTGCGASPVRWFRALQSKYTVLQYYYFFARCQMQFFYLCETQWCGLENVTWTWAYPFELISKLKQVIWEQTTWAGFTVYSALSVKTFLHSEVTKAYRCAVCGHNDDDGGVLLITQECGLLSVRLFGQATQGLFYFIFLLERNVRSDITLRPWDKVFLTCD